MPICNICKKENTSEFMTKDKCYCRSCYKTKYVLPRKFKTKVEDELPEYRGQILRYPGQWFNKEQEQDVSFILTTIGWKYNKEKNVWYDNKIKDMNGEWLVAFKKYKKTRWGGRGKYYDLIQSIGRIPYVTYQSKEAFFSDDQIKEIQHRFFIDGESAGYLTKDYNCDPIQVQWVVAMTYKKLREIKKSNDKTITRSNKST
jgi:hypothetical protein